MCCYYGHGVLQMLCLYTEGRQSCVVTMDMEYFTTCCVSIQRVDSHVLLLWAWSTSNVVSLYRG